MSLANPVFEENYSYYLDEIAKVDFEAVKDTLKCRVEGDQLVIPFFGREYRGVPPSPRPMMGGCRSRILKPHPILRTSTILPVIRSWPS